MSKLPYCPVCGTLAGAHTTAMLEQCKTVVDNVRAKELARQKAAREKLSAFFPPVHKS